VSHPVDTAQLDRLRRSCVECGLCLPYCATYLATGNEAQSPRGRLLLLGEVHAGRLSAGDPAVREAFSQCLGCLACTATCPSGVSADLLGHLRELAAAAGPRRPRPVRLLDRRSLLRSLRVLGGAASRAAARLFGPRWRRRFESGPVAGRRLARLVGTLPAGPGRDEVLIARLDSLVRDRQRPARPAATLSAPVGKRVAVFRGCADRNLLPDTARRLEDLLRGLGCTLMTPNGQDCCGALASHLASRGRATRLRRRNRHAFAPHLAACEHVMVAAAGCGQELSSQPGELASKVIDAVTLLDELAPATLAPLPLRVAVHDPCHARHGLGVHAAPRRLLARIPGVQVLEPAEAEVCCGSAGVYGVQHPELSAIMGRRKAEALAATACDLVVTTNPGCLGQIADGLALVAPEIPILPLTDLVWYAHRDGPPEETT